MNFQKIILVGKIINKPTFMKTEEGVLDVMKFNLGVKYFTEEEVVFKVMVTGIVDERYDLKAEEGREVIVEGIVELDKDGNYLVSADGLEFGNKDLKRTELLF